VLSILSVSETTRYLREVLESDDLLRDVWVAGEVSNLVKSQAGHLYFTLKDSEAQLRCVVFRGHLHSLACLPQNNMAIVAHGRISLYEVAGTVQLYADAALPQGLGALYLRFEQLRAQLEREGLFDPRRKRPLPGIPRCVAVVTSPTGAVLHDIITVTERRFPRTQLVVVPTLVQGDGAPAAIAGALEAAQLVPGVEVIILALGGGSLEDLWPFNEEQVARAIYASRVPVVTGVGHQTDVTIADLVADLRAATPSAAAELVVPDQREYAARISTAKAQAQTAIEGLLETLRHEVADRVDRLESLVPPPRIITRRQWLDDQSVHASRAISTSMALRRERLRSRALQIEALSPMGVLERGYAVCWHLASGQPVKRVSQVAPGDKVEIQVTDGSFSAQS
jgi:exodeoxyribonuclease VII large subunit